MQDIGVESFAGRIVEMIVLDIEVLGGFGWLVVWVLVFLVVLLVLLEAILVGTSWMLACLESWLFLVFLFLFLLLLDVRVFLRLLVLFLFVLERW